MNQITHEWAAEWVGEVLDSMKQGEVRCPMGHITGQPAEDATLTGEYEDGILVLVKAACGCEWTERVEG